MKGRSKTLLLAIVAAIALVAAFVLPHRRSLAQSQPLLQITSPPDGTIVAPGQTITVVVTPAPGVNFILVGILGEHPIGSDQVLSAPPFQFSLTIPTKISAGRYKIFAFGATAPGKGGQSATISLDVEPSLTITKIRVEPLTVTFKSAGERMPLAVIGTFSDGSTMRITRSSRTTYSSNDTRVATVSSTGVVTAVGPGTTGATGVIVRFGNQSVPIPVSTILMVDRTPPITRATLSPAPNANGWNNTNVTVTLTATDNEPRGTGVRQIQFSLAGAQSSGPQVVNGSTASVTITTEGITTVTYFATDNSGNNEAAKTRTVRVDQTPPVVTIAAAPATLWPPNGNMVPVTISGSINDATSGVDTGRLAFAVTDEYGIVQPSGSVTLAPDGSYSFTILLQASRRDDDFDGRQYTIVVSATDNAGNTGSASTVVTVPHDQG